jgi:hypothetical protein
MNLVCLSFNKSVGNWKKEKSRRTLFFEMRLLLYNKSEHGESTSQLTVLYSSANMVAMASLAVRLLGEDRS